MRLPAIPFLTKSVPTEFFLALIFESDKVSSILFKEQDKKLLILGSTETPIDLEGTSAEELIVACDKVISRIEGNLPEDANLEKTIFATPYSWVEEGKIKPERLAILKKVSEELALTPMGFIVSVEAIIAFLQKKEGAPVNGIFVEVSEKYLSAYIVRSNNVIDVQMGPIDGSVESTVERLLAQVTKLDVLPSKIVLLHNKEAEEISQRFLSHHWTKDLPFMHLPQVSILEKGFESEAIISGVASQLNSDVGGDISSEAEVMKDEESSLVEVSSDDFGFAVDEDIALKKEEPENKVDENIGSGDDFEFSKEEAPVKPIVRHHDDNASKTSPAESEFEEDIPEKSAESTGSFAGRFGSSISSFFTPRSIFGIINNFRNFRKFIVPFCALIVVVVLLISYYSFIVNAKVIVFTDQKAFSENAMSITLTSSGESSFEDKVLKIQTIEQSVSGEQSQETTGTKDTGEKATGSLTIFNKTEAPKQLDKGTTVVSSNNLEFTLTDSVNIASTSSFSTSFSSAQAKVTASNFGKEYNLPSATNFTVEGVSASDVFGKNDQAFSGGSKEQIQVVSKKDLQALESAVTSRLFDKAKSQAEAGLSEGSALIPNYLSYEFEDKQFDRKENDVAKNVKLTATVLYTLGSYNKEDLIKFISSSDDFDVPDEFELSDSESSIKISDISQDGSDLSAKLSFKAVFKPQLDQEKIPELVAGKGTDSAVEILKKTQGVSDVSIQYGNVIPFLPKIIPLNKANIMLEFKSE